MRTGQRMPLRLPLLLISCFMLVSACQSGGGGGTVEGNEKGSAPVNGGEAIEYKKAVVRCYKSGGTRIVKIMGELRCY